MLKRKSKPGNISAGKNKKSQVFRQSFLLPASSQELFIKVYKKISLLSIHSVTVNAPIQPSTISPSALEPLLTGDCVVLS